MSPISNTLVSFLVHIIPLYLSLFPIPSFIFLPAYCWEQPDIPSPRPTPRYGQSQLLLDSRHLLVLGGCGGPNNVFTDVWLLSLDAAPHWRWTQCQVRNAEANGAAHMWCHPAVK